MVLGLYYIEHQRGPISLPLLDVSVEASIKELAAQVKLTQTYGNNASLPIEAVYAFPVPARAAVCSFVMIKQDGSRVVGSVQEKQEARETYNTAVSQGKQASLMEQQTPDVFQVSVGNIPSEEQVKIELIYATELSEDEENDSVRFHLPVTVGARYGSAPTSPLSPRNPFSPTYGRAQTFLRIAMSVETIAPIAKIGCPSHTVSTELGPDPALPNLKELPFANYARVSLTSDSPLDKDFVLTIKSAGLDTPRCVAELHPDPSHNTVALGLTFVPRFKLPDLARQEFIFVVDRSGSMEDARIAAARKALVVLLRSLPAKDSLFQIVSFGSLASSLWESGSKAYNQQTLEEATRHVDGMGADYGGTEIRKALQYCFDGRRRDRPTSVFVLTDGEAWNLDAVLGVVKTAVAGAPQDAPLRVSVLGIGDSVSTAMCEGIARVGCGACMLVGEQEASFTGKIARLLKASKTPVISNISVDWGCPPSEVSKVSEVEDDFEMVDDAEVAQKKTLNVFDEDVDPIQVDETQAPPPPPVMLPAPPAVQQSPFKIRNLFPGVRLNVYAILQGRNVPKTVTLRGSTAEGAEIELPIPVTLSRLQNDPGAPTAIHALAARKIIQDLEDGQHGLSQTLSNPDDADLLARTVKASIVRLGKTYSITSKHTSFVAVDDVTPVVALVDDDEEEVEVEDFVDDQTPPPPPAPSAPPPRSRAAPGGPASKPDLSGYNYGAISSLVLTADRSSLPRVPPPNLLTAAEAASAGGPSWYMRGPSARLGPPAVSRRVRAAPAAAVPAAPPAPPPAARGLYRKQVDEAQESAKQAQLDALLHKLKGGPADSGMQDEDDDEEEYEEVDYVDDLPPPQAAVDPVEALARLQSFDGCFSPAVFAFVGIDIEAVRALFPAGAGDGIIATVLAMAFLSTKLGADVERESWEGMYEKAKEYVEEALGMGDSVERLEAEVGKMLA